VQNNGETVLKNIYFKGEFEFIDSGQLLSEVASLELQNGLAKDVLSDEILIKSDWGYNADSKADFIKQKNDWRQVQVKLYAKEKDAPHYVLLGTYPIAQVIEGVKVVYQ
jgi:hypothetical protein